MIKVRRPWQGVDDREVWMSACAGGDSRRDRISRVPLISLTAAIATGVLAVAPPSAVAAPAAVLPSVGECFDLPAEELVDRAGWLDPTAIDCRLPHTFEVTRVGPLPEGDGTQDPTRLAAAQCGDLGVWNEVGVNRPMAGIVTDPLRIQARSFAVREPVPSYVCGAVAVEWSRRGELQVIPLSSSIEGLTVEERDGLRYCSRARGVRRPWSQLATVPCSTQPRWEATSWVLWTAFYDENPGRARLRTRAAALCGAGARFSLPRTEQWTTGLPWTRCYERRP